MIAKQNKQAARPVHPAVEQMPSATREMYPKLQKLYESTTRNELHKRYDIGAIVKVLMADEGKYGQNVLRLLADALAVGVDYLYRCKSLASTWTWEEIGTLRSRLNCFGRRIEFTHLLLIANLPASKTRGELLDEFFRKGLTTRELEQRIKKLIGKSKPSQPGRPKSPSAGLAAMRKVAADFDEKRGVWQETVFDPIEDTTGNGGEISYLDDLIKTKQLHEELWRQVEANIEDLGKCIRCSEAARDAAQKAKRYPKATTPSRPRVNVKKAKAKASVGRRRVVE